VIAIGPATTRPRQEIVAETGHQPRGRPEGGLRGHDRRADLSRFIGVPREFRVETDGDGQSRCPCLGRDAKPGPTLLTAPSNQLSHPSRFLKA